MSDSSYDPIPAEPAQVDIEPPKKPRLWSAFLVTFVGFPAAIVFSIIVAAIYVLAVYGLGAAADRTFVRGLASDPSFLVVIVVAMEVGIALAVFVPALLSPVPWYRRLGLVSFPGYGAKLPVLMLATFAVNFLLTATLPRLVGEPSDYLMPLMDAFLGSGVLSKALLVIAITIIAGFAEEIFFRGYLQRRLLQRWPVWLSIGTASLLFAFAHGSLAYAAYVFPLGLWLGIVAWRTGSIWCSAACHAFNNLIGVVMLFVGAAATEGVDMPVAAEIALILVALGVLIWAVMLLRGPRPAEA